MRMLNLGVLALALASAFLLYGINYDTRMMAQRLQDKERAIERARSDIAVLKAERAHLARPERIESLARAQGLRPTSEQQLVVSPEEVLVRALAAAPAGPAAKARGD